MQPTGEQILQAPKVLLHDHLDGGLRPATIIELAAGIGHALPATTPETLADWFAESADSGSLERYLETFAHTVAVMQTADAITRVAREAVEDLAADGVVYAEIRYAPELHVDGGLELEEVVAAVQRGFDEGMAAADGTIVVRQLLTAMRQAARASEIAKLAIEWRERGAAGFDIAGPEAGFPPTRFLAAFELLAAENVRYTIHAGEGFGLPSIWEAVHPCGADRLGHGVRIAEDITVGADGTAALGKLAAYVRDRRIPLEICPRSNVQTGAAASIAEHPIGLLADLGFRVTVNTDNRLMSRTSMSIEMQGLVDELGWDLAQLEKVTVNAMKSAFLHYDERVDLIHRIKERYAALRG
ncbi:adenosine deaminase [Nocardioides nematodiphilus]|uniref:adenosine deaminase n=1 Tax=Nocardioides nematodiphilus TaxID=2849669 RepID=UPI001CD9E116|nr:adenosine deaminase [Nocardioides nematodiphilus]MCA1983560.1 adenosine deaminase [Nocardioides nematodiphilus]